MILHYIWIKDFKNILNQGFKFSDRFNVAYDPDSGILDIQINEKYIPGFFPGNVKSVTAVIGANGAGKSNLFEYLKYTLASFSKGASALYDHESIIIFDTDIFYHEHLSIANRPELESKGFTFFDYKESLAHFMNDNRNEHELDDPDKIYENAYIYYSSILDLRSEYHPWEVIDVSTNSLIYRDSYGNRYRFDKSLNPYRHQIDNLDAFEVTEVERQIDFVSENYGNYPFSFPLPKYISMRIEEQHNTYIAEKHNFFEQNNLTEFDKIWLSSFSTPSAANNIKFIDVYKQIFIYKLLIILQYNHPEQFQTVTELKFREIVFEGNHLAFREIYDEEKSKLIINLLNLLDELLQLSRPVENEDDRDFMIKYDTIEIPYNSATAEIFVKFYMNYKIIIEGKKYLAFHWGGLSSGELTMLNFYSRLNAATKDHRLNDRKHVIVMIDEGETNLHPVWQMRFLNEMMTFFNTKLVDYTVQIIATSHSPFLVSNLPKTMINFLDKDEQGNCVVADGLTDLKQTFGANINTLYTDSFFTRQTLMGDFAKHKLDRIIHIINKEKGFDEEFPNWDVVQNYIDIIGEPLIKGMLQRQLNHNRALTTKDIHLLRVQITELEQRIKKIEDNDSN